MQSPDNTVARDNVFSVTARDFDDKVAKSAVPVLVDFWAPWCQPCQQIAPMLDALADKFSGRLAVAKVNVDEETTLAAGFGVRSIPMLLLFSNGKVVEQVIGVQPPEELVKLVGKHLTGAPNALRLAAQNALLAGDHASALPILLQARESEPDNPGIIVDIARSQLALGDATSANETLESLSVAASQATEIETLRNQIRIALSAADGTDIDALQARHASNPDDLQARHELAIACAAAQQYTSALSHFYALMKADRSFANGAGQQGLLQIFGVLGNQDERVQDYRRKMANLLN